MSRTPVLTDTRFDYRRWITNLNFQVSRDNQNRKRKRSDDDEDEGKCLSLRTSDSKCIQDNECIYDNSKRRKIEVNPLPVLIQGVRGRNELLICFLKDCGLEKSHRRLNPRLRLSWEHHEFHHHTLPSVLISKLIKRFGRNSKLYQNHLLTAKD